LQTWDLELFGGHQWAPWTIAGGPDPDYDDVDRTVHHALLTDPSC
jgi:hypothetical protein